MDAVMLYNPIAGRGRAERVARHAAERLTAAGWRVREGASTHAGHVTELAREHGPEVDRVIAVGGDGSLRDAAKGLLELARRPALGLLPLGFGNVVAREYGIPLAPEKAIEVLLDGEPRPLDVGLANGEPFLAMLGVGYDATVAHWMGKVRRRPWLGRWYRWSGGTLYGVLGASALFQQRQVRFRISVDGNHLAGRYCAAIIGNMETYAKGMAMTPGALPDDGLLDLHARKRAFAPWAAWSLACGWVRARSPRWIVDSAHGRSLVIEPERPVRWQLDGDPMGVAEEIAVEVRPGALEIVAPGAVYEAVVAVPAGG